MSNGARRAMLACALGGAMAFGGFAVVPASAQSCDGSYPDFCIQPPYEVGDLDCYHIPANNFTVHQPDPHYFDGDYDGVGCEAY